MKKLILVNGIPASGKSTISRVISEYFNFPVLSIDDIKEPFMVQFSKTIDRTLNRKLGHAAYEAMFNIVRASPPDSTFILDAWFGFQEKSVLLAYLERCGVTKTIEIWNSISPELVAERYQHRCSVRVKGHPGEEYISELVILADKAQPMAFSDIYTVDQDQGVNNKDLIAWVKRSAISTWP